MVGMTSREKLPLWWKDGLAQETACVMMDWNKGTFGVVDGLVQNCQCDGGLELENFQYSGCTSTENY